MAEGLCRVTWLANYREWANLPDDAYAEAKRSLFDPLVACAEGFMP